MMIRIGKFTAGICCRNIIYKYSSADPYYILGVQKSTDFDQIRKSFYKLANQYHPDKNDSLDAKKKFLLIKQAFEQIKIQKGLMKPQNFVDPIYYQTVRPNADIYTPDQEQGSQSTHDYKVYQEKASMDQKYQRFNQSFQTIHDINDIKIKVEEGQMKDTALRFNLDSFKAKIIPRSQNSMMVLFIGLAGLFLLLDFFNTLFFGIESNTKKKEIIQNSVASRQAKIQSEEVIKKKIAIENQQKIKGQDLLNFIQSKKEKNQKKPKTKINQATVWSKSLKSQQQQFLTSNERCI